MRSDLREGMLVQGGRLWAKERISEGCERVMVALEKLVSDLGDGRTEGGGKKVRIGV